MRLKIMILLLIIFNYAINACADSEKEIKYWDVVLKEAIVIVPELKNIKLATEEDLLIFKDYGKDIVNIHLHDAITGKDGHLPLGSGDLKLSWFFKLLKKYNYNGYVNLEMLNNDDVLSSWSKIIGFI